MLLSSLPGFSHQLRYGDYKPKIMTDFATSAALQVQNKRKSSFSSVTTISNVKSHDYSPSKSYQEVLIAAREKFTQQISFRSKDKDISLAKTLLYIAAEDEAFMAHNREMDAQSFQNEQNNSNVLSDRRDWDCIETMPMAGKKIDDWLLELDNIANEVKVELSSRDIGCHLVEVLEAVNKVLFESIGFRRSPVVDSKCSYLHSVLSSKYGSAILLSIIYIEICQRLKLTIVGSRVGEDFLIWPKTGNPEELFKVNSGHSLFGIVNGRCVEDPKSMASDLTCNSLPGLDIATNRDIIGIYLANLIRLHWKRASRINHGLMLTSPLRRVHDDNGKWSKINGSSMPLLRPQDLRLAIMASERLLILQPHNWALRRDHGMMWYYSRDYGKAVQELSICMAFAPEEEAEVLEPFVEKLHLLQLESSWKSRGHKGRLTVP
ncbi:putative protein SirB1 [Helianthus annuus]|nr:putative protein SirB1 [Helianthus annuus]